RRAIGWPCEWGERENKHDCTELEGLDGKPGLMVRSLSHWCLVQIERRTSFVNTRERERELIKVVSGGGQWSVVVDGGHWWTVITGGHLRVQTWVILCS